MSLDNERIVATLRKNAREQIRVATGEYHGRKIVSLRVFFEAADGEWRPGKGGMAFAIALLPELTAALGKAVPE